MTSDIGERQNQPLFADRLAAQRELYSRAKRILVWQTVASVPCSVLLTILAIFVPAAAAYSAAWGVVVSLVDLCVSTRAQKSRRQLAASVQELIDTDLFRLEWRQLKAGQRPRADLVQEFAAAYKARARSLSDLTDWYPAAVDRLPAHLARLVCQRENCWWDARIRQRYAVGAMAAAVVLVIATVLVGIIHNIPFQSYLLSVFVPMAPVLTLGIKGFVEHRETVVQLEKLHAHIETVWQAAIAGAPEADMTKQSRDIQDEIFDLRRSDPMVFDWIDNRLRTGNERLMKASADELVEEALGVRRPVGARV